MGKTQKWKFRQNRKTAGKVKKIGENCGKVGWAKRVGNCLIITNTLREFGQGGFLLKKKPTAEIATIFTAKNFRKLSCVSTKQ